MNISLEDFEYIISTLRNIEKRVDELNKLNVNLIEYDEDYHKVIDVFLKNILSKEQYDWFGWWLYERITPWNDEPLEAFDKHGKEIELNTIEEFYKFLKTV